MTDSPLALPVVDADLERRLVDRLAHIDELLEKVRESDATVAQSSSGATYAGEPDPYKKPRAGDLDELEDE